MEAARADARVFRDGHRHFETSDASLRSLHYVAGGRFYAIGNVHAARQALPPPTLR